MAKIKTPKTFWRTPGRPHKPYIIFIHHYQGSEKTLRKHAEMLNTNGFDCVTFNLTSQSATDWLKPAQVTWAEELENIIQQIEKDEPDLKNRPKILYGFSGPSTCALRVIKKHLEEGKNDITGLICDSGPFLDSWYCTRIMLEEVKGMKNPITREILLALMMFRWDIRHTKHILEITEKISKLKPTLPILLMQGEQDRIVPPKQINAVFDRFNLPNLKKCLLPNTNHLTGLKNDSELYTKTVVEFLKNLV